MNEKPVPSIIYIGDPMCSWCYGIAPELSELKMYYQGRVDFDIVLGGLRPYNQQTMFELKDFLKGHWQHVHEASNQPFNYSILENQSITYDTEPPCRAVVTVRSMDESKTLSFFNEIQKDFYYDNKNMHKLESYDEALEKVGIDKEKFSQRFQSEEMKEKVKEDFKLTAEMGVSGFPTILLKQGDHIQMVASGYMKAESLIQKIDGMLKQH
ncbi:MAG: DsbA family protein [Saprospiraceae bacterium]|nr:DsbA family protein [Bacteroidia bacterium]NNE15998.1 DsbA family protein [Saprospiraceae bacterium]NNL93854.1 DsbA family protein [Saprospiraceae bacterium]